MGEEDMRRIIAITGLIAAATLPGGLAWAAPNPNGSGQPNQDCVDIVLSGGTEPGNGHAASSPGSPFNEADLTGGSGGTGGAAYDNAGAPSQYDVACYQLSSR
jgi:hypothetical protein